MPADDNVEREAPSMDEGREFDVAAGHEGDRESLFYRQELKGRDGGPRKAESTAIKSWHMNVEDPVRTRH